MPGAIGVTLATVDQVPQDAVRFIGALGLVPPDPCARMMLLAADTGNLGNFCQGIGEVVDQTAYHRRVLAGYRIMLIH